MITGYYADANGVGHGFLRTHDGSFTTFDAPGAAGTFPSNVASTGAITGNYLDANGTSHGFLRIPHGAHGNK